MKILIVSQYFWPENFRINDLTQELVQRGHSVSILTGIPNYPAGIVFDEYKKTPDSFRRYVNAEVFRVPMLARGKRNISLLLNYISFAVSACLLGPWRLRGRQFDVIFVFQTSPVTVGLPAILLGRVKQAPVVFWVLDLWPESLAAVGVVRSAKLLNWVGHLVRFIYAHCTLVLGQSRSFVSSIAKYCSDVQKIRHFSNWTEDAATETDLVPASEVPVLNDVFNVLFAGNLGDAQDLPAILKAAEILKSCVNLRWLIVGDGRKFDWLQKEVRRRNLQDIVLVLGRYPLARMPSFYAHANALLVSLKKDPAFSQTIPGKVQSYLMAGIPLVGMLDGEGSDVIMRANAGLVCEAGDSNGLAAAVTAMAAMTVDQRQQLGLNGRAFARKEFDRGLQMDRLEAFLHEAVVLYKKHNARARRF